ncbi:ATP-binding protein [Thalassobaculum litoreum]|uniref:histidine kinase n=1 Tax=Thalassobaculum litoreum DSM 18839 TaxID=1123362 RepID=A0A8G2BNM9_9PROT|nr:ATP-binding protein [Thalassobaculum litoreum]SDG59704.1 PAS domain S-box-containing protein [Thalassobaculum litoreum DSM 18839]
MQKRARKTLNCRIVGVFAATVLICLAVGVYGQRISYLQEKQHAQVDAVIDLHENVMVPLNALSRNIGFGGLIHNFKNYVLRGDLVYADAADANARVALGELDRLDAILQQPEAQRAIDLVRGMVRQYQEKLGLAVAMHGAQARVEDLDATVRFDDRAALEGLDILYELTKQRISPHIASAKHFSHELESLLGASVLVFIVLIAGAVALCFMLIGQYRLTIRLAEAHQEVNALISAAPDVVIYVGADGKIRYANDRAFELLGYEASELLGQSIETLVPEAARGEHVAHRKDYMRSPRSGPMTEARDLIARAKDGSSVPVSIGLSTHFHEGERIVIAAIRDVSVERAMTTARETLLQGQLHQADKLRTVGTLAGGIAHDFNNILTPIMGYSDLLLATLPDESLEREDVKVIKRAAGRAREIVAQLLAFSRPGDDLRSIVSVSASIAETSALVRPTIPPNVTLTVSGIGDGPMVEANAGRLQQVLVNLIRNAVDALGARGGSIAVRYLLDEAPAGDRTAGGMARQVRIEIEDNGPGMTPEVTSQVFDPFFTTKPVGQGSGLGLSVAYGIVTSWNGRLKVRSEHEKGTVFTILLPVSTETPEAASPEAALPGGGCVLVVDDDPDVLSVTGRMLAQLGYEPVLMSRVNEALEYLDTETEEPIAALSDHSMPGRPASDLQAAVARRWPGVPFITISGFDLSGLENMAQNSIVLRKPITMVELSSAIARARMRQSETN